MKVAIYANLHTQSGAGGVQTYMAALIKALAELQDGAEEYLLIGPRRHSEWLEEICGPNQRVIRLPIQRLEIARHVARGVSRFRGYIRRQSSLVYRVGGHTVLSGSFSDFARAVPASNGFIESLGPSVIHFPYQEFIVTSIPSIFNPHDLQHLHLPQFFTPEKQISRELCFPFACRVASQVVVASNWVAADLCEKYSIPLKKIAVIPWGGATAAWRKPDPAEIGRVRDTYRLPEQYLFYPAAAWPHKNHERLIQAIALLNTRGIRVTLVLSGAQTSLSQHLRNQATELGLSEQIAFLGHVPGMDMRSLYAGASAVVVPTLFEAASGPVVEAWQEGTPVVCSDIPQLRDQADGAAVFADPLDCASIASGIETVLKDGERRAQLIAAGWERVSRLSWRATAVAYRNLYREVAKRAGTD